LVLDGKKTTAQHLHKQTTTTITITIIIIIIIIIIKSKTAKEFKKLEATYHSE
jgi:preprotein translocase subunit SecG